MPGSSSSRKNCIVSPWQFVSTAGAQNRCLTSQVGGPGQHLTLCNSMWCEVQYLADESPKRRRDKDLGIAS